MFERWRWLAAGALCTVLAHAAPSGSITIASFSKARPSGDVPDGWTQLIIAGARAPTTYELVGDGSATELRAQSNNSASGLTRRLRSPPTPTTPGNPSSRIFGDISLHKRVVNR